MNISKNDWEIVSEILISWNVPYLKAAPGLNQNSFFFFLHNYKIKLEEIWEKNLKKKLYHVKKESTN